MTIGDLPEAWLRISKDQWKTLRSAHAYSASPGEIMRQIDSITGWPVHQRGEDFYVQLPPNYRTASHWNANIDQTRIEQVFSEQQMSINVDTLKRLLEDHDRYLFRKTEEEIEERERQSLREQILLEQQIEAYADEAVEFDYSPQFGEEEDS